MRWIEAVALFVALAGGIVQGASALQMPQNPQLPQAPPIPPLSTPPPPAQVQPRFLVVVDAAHGGQLIRAPASQEGFSKKDITLGLSSRLRSTLHAHGIEVVITRQADVSLLP